MTRSPREDPDADLLIGLSYDELMNEKEANLLALADINGQIASAKATVLADGKYSDPDWWARLNGAKRYRGRRDQLIANRLGVIRKEIHQANLLKKKERPGLPTIFMRVVRDAIDAKTYDTYLDEAKDVRDKMLEGEEYGTDLREPKATAEDVQEGQRIG